MPTLVLKDGVMEVDRELLQASGLLKDKQDAEILLPEVDKATMTLIVEYLTAHVDRPFPALQKPLTTHKLDVILAAHKWELVWLKRLSPINEDLSALIECKKVYETVLAAHYLGIDPLVQLLTMTIATWLKARTPRQLRRALGMNEDPTPEFEARIIAENAWVFDEVKRPKLSDGQSCL